MGTAGARGQGRPSAAPAERARGSGTGGLGVDWGRGDAGRRERTADRLRRTCEAGFELGRAGQSRKPPRQRWHKDRGKAGPLAGPRVCHGGGRGGGSPNTRRRTMCWKATSPQEPTHTRGPAADSEALSTERTLLPAPDCTAPRLVSRPRHCTEAVLPSSQARRQVNCSDSPTATATSGSGGSTSSGPPAGDGALSPAPRPQPQPPPPRPSNVGSSLASPNLRTAPLRAPPLSQPLLGSETPAPLTAAQLQQPQKEGKQEGEALLHARSPALSTARGGGGLNTGAPGSFSPPPRPATPLPLPLLQLLPGGFPRGFPTLTPDPGGDREAGTGGQRWGRGRPKSEPAGGGSGPIPGFNFRD